MNTRTPTTSSNHERQIFSVSLLNRTTKHLLETQMALVWVEGELTNLACPSSGHWYFTLKDSKAQIRCAMFRQRNRSVTKPPASGDKVLVRARVSIYEGRGDYQLIVEHLEPAGLGDLQRQFDQLKLALANEGLFDEHHKQPLPDYPKHIGVITSPTGAVIRDIIHVVARRYPQVLISVFPVAVQGEQAAPEITKAITTANALSDCDLLIVGRGGGSLEDLWAFNEESVARAIFASELPIISAVGHETDITIADFVADLRAPTPSAAAELCTPDRQELQQQLTGYRYLMKSAMESRLEQWRAQLQLLRTQLRHPGQTLQSQAQYLDNLEIRLKQAAQLSLQLGKDKQKRAHERLQQANPTNAIAQQSNRIEHLLEKLVLVMRQQLAFKRQALASNAALLDSVSPLAVLNRGYSITSTEDDNRVVTSASAVKIGQKIRTKLADGTVTSVVESTQS